MRMLPSTFRISLMVLITFSAALSSPVRAYAQYGSVCLPALTATTRIGKGIKSQTALFAFAALRYQGRGSIGGQVLLPSGQPVNNRVKVSLTGYRIPDMTTYTDTKGKFLFITAGDGTYTLEVTADSDLYEPVIQEVRVIYGSAPPQIIMLRKKTNAAIKSITSVVSASELEQQVPDAAKKEFEKGAELSAKGRIQDAIERFKKAIDIFPNYLMARNNLGAQYLKLGRWPEAAEQFKAAIEINSKAFSPLLNLAIALIEQKKYADAVESLNQAISIDHSSPTAHLYLGIASLGIDEIDQAERELSTALSLGGAEYSLPHFFLALVYMKKGEREPAIRELNAYLKKTPDGERAPRARQLLEKLKQ